MTDPRLLRKGSDAPLRDFAGIDSLSDSLDDVSMKTFAIKELLADFSRILRRVTAGEEVIIKRVGTPVARLVPVEPLTVRDLGIDAGLFSVPDDFNDPIAGNESDLFDC